MKPVHTGSNDNWCVGIPLKVPLCWYCKHAAVYDEYEGTLFYYGFGDDCANEAHSWFNSNIHEGTNSNCDLINVERGFDNEPVELYVKITIRSGCPNYEPGNNGYPNCYPCLKCNVCGNDCER
jgi:hypothetical protein